MQVIEFGDSITGEFVGIDPDQGFGARLRVRVGAPTERRPQGLEQLIDFYPFDPKTGRPTLPHGLRAGDVVRCVVDVRGKGYRSADRGVSGLVTRALRSIEVLEGVGDEAMAALADLGAMAVSPDRLVLDLDGE